MNPPLQDSPEGGSYRPSESDVRSTSQQQSVVCSDCGLSATTAVVHPNTSPDIATPYCDRCLNGLCATEQDVYDHEMRNFGGMYGVPSHKEYPVNIFKWYVREDGRFQATI